MRFHRLPILFALVLAGALAGALASTAAADTFSPSTATAGVSQTFTTDTIGTSYQWDFGDGTTITTSSSSSASHTYGTAGTYHVDVKTLGPDGIIVLSEYLQDVTVLNPPPPTLTTISASPRSPAINQSVSFSSDARDPDDLPLSYAWDFGDGTTSLSATPTHSYATANSYIVSLTVSDAFGGSKTRSIAINVSPAPDIAPTATAGASPLVTTPNQPVSFSSLGTQDPDQPAGTPLTYQWTFGDFSSPSNLTDPTHAYAAAGHYVVKLKVTDASGASDTDSVTVDVQNVTPPNHPPAVALSPSTNSARPGQVVQLFANATDQDQSPSTLIYAWDFGDRTTSTLQNPIHAYSSPGTYTVRVTVTDASGSSASDTDKIVVQAVPPAGDQPPVASVRSSRSRPTTGQAITLTGIASDPDGSVVARGWDLDNDGTFGNDLGVARDGRTARVTFTRAGRHIVRFRATDNGGASTIAQLAIVVRNRPPVADFTFSPPHPRVGQRILLVSTSRDPDGPLASLHWDRDGDGKFHNGTTTVQHVTFSKPGKHRVGIQVTDGDGTRATRYRTIVIAPRAYTPLSPFPVVEVAGTAGRSSSRLRLIQVRAPRGSMVSLYCHGGGCPSASWSVLARTGRPIRAVGFQRRLAAGTFLVITVTKPGRIGKYTSLLIRSRRRAPTRRDLCLVPGRRPPARCP